jgi:hypothetical protein
MAAITYSQVVSDQAGAIVLGALKANLTPPMESKNATRAKS